LTIGVSGELYQFDIPAHAWATLCTKPVTSINSTAHNQVKSTKSEIRIICRGEEYCITLPSRKTGHIELMTVTGQILESIPIRQDTREILLQKKMYPPGLLLVRVKYGETTTNSIRFYNLN